MNTSTVLVAQYAFPWGNVRAPLTSSGDVEQPRLKTHMSSRGHPSTPTASTTARPVGLFAHTPPSISGTPVVSQYVGKYVGAAAVAIATSTARVLKSRSKRGECAVLKTYTSPVSRFVEGIARRT